MKLTINDKKNIDLDINNSIINNQLLDLMVQEYKIRQSKKKLKKTQSKGLHKKKNKTYKNWEKNRFWR